MDTLKTKAEYRRWVWDVIARYLLPQDHEGIIALAKSEGLNPKRAVKMADEVYAQIRRKAELPEEGDLDI